jgi:protein tyrosine phosphatase
LEAEVEILKNAVVQRHFSIENEDITVIVTQLQIICWDDHSVPGDELGYKSIEMVSTYIDEHRIDSNSPIVIHCR